VRKYRENKKKEECNGGVTLQKRNSNAIDTDTDTDTEKKKKETKKKKFTPSFSPPPHIDSALWDEFIKHRKAMKSPMTDMAKKMLVGRLETLRAGGHNPDDLLKTAIMNGWKSVYPEKPETKPIGSIRNERLAREFQNQNTEGPGHDRGTVSALLCREKAGRG